MNEKNKIISDGLTRIIDWIKFADAKAAVVGTICAVYLGFGKGIAVSYIDLITETYSKQQNEVRLLIPTLAVCGLFYFLMRTLFFILRTLKAATINTDYNPLFFGHIAQKSLEDYTTLVQKRTVNQLNKDLLKQTHTNSQIAIRKFGNVNEAIFSIIIATIFLIASGVSLSVVR